MGYALYYGERRQVLRVAYTGRHSDEIVRAAVADVEAFLAKHKAEIGILDFSEVKSIEVSPDLVRELALGPRHYREYFLVAPNSAEFGFSRMFQTFRGGAGQVKVVRNIGDVYQQLAIAPSELKLIASSDSEPESTNS